MIKKSQSIMDYFGRCPTDTELRNLIYKQAERIEQLEKDIKFHEMMTAKYITIKEKQL